MNVLRRWALTVVSLVTLVGCDHVTKHVAKAELESQAPRQVIGRVLDLRYVENTDVAFNLLRWLPESVRGPTLLGLGAIGVLALAVIVARRKGNALTRAALVLILAGALGNYLDRFFRGYVVDFIHVPHWPVFNVADMCVSVGAAALILARLLSPRASPSQGPPSLHGA